MLCIAEVKSLHKFVNLSLTITNIMNAWTDLCGISLLHFVKHSRATAPEDDERAMTNFGLRSSEHPIINPSHHIAGIEMELVRSMRSVHASTDTHTRARARSLSLSLFL